MEDFQKTAGIFRRVSTTRAWSQFGAGIWVAILVGLRPWGGWADGPADNMVDKVRRVPPAGVAISAAARSELMQESAALLTQLDSLRRGAVSNRFVLDLLPDAQIFHKSVDWALRYDEVFRTNEVDAARQQLREGFRRVAELREGRASWAAATGMVVRAYTSKIDGSVQPYGLVIPPSWTPTSGRKWRLDFWFHGRGEQLTELAFVNDRMRNPGEFVPADTLVLHLYGRYCNGSRFAGETDFWEAFEDVKRRYAIDENRLVVRGFSLGGAACWHMATHFAWRWAAAAPGAGFSETAEFLRVFQKETLKPTEWEQKLWRWYDATEHALNVSMTPLVAYSGADDTQIQAAQAMEKAMAAEGLELTHLIAPGTGHRYEPVAKAELNRRIDAAAAIGRDPLPREIRWVTHTLRYPEAGWVVVDGLDRHWDKARIEAEHLGSENRVRLRTTNVQALTLRMPAGLAPFEPRRPVTVEIDGQRLVASKPGSDRSWTARLYREKSGMPWQLGADPRPGLRKRAGLQGPIDDAFMDSFMMVMPGATALNGAVGGWVERESARAIEHWRRHYRGEARQKVDVEVNDDDIAQHHLVLWGDPKSNRVLAKIADRLPIKWTEAGVQVGAKTYAVGQHVPVLIFPNPLNPSRYVVLNSGFTFREYDYLNNARQTPKLPDWAVVDLSQPANSRAPGGIVSAGFFDDSWRLE